MHQSTQPLLSHDPSLKTELGILNETANPQDPRPENPMCCNNKIETQEQLTNGFEVAKSWRRTERDAFGVVHRINQSVPRLWILDYHRKTTYVVAVLQVTAATLLTDTHTHTDRDTDTETEAERERETDRDRQTDRQSDSQTVRKSDSQKPGQELKDFDDEAPLTSGGWRNFCSLFRCLASDLKQTPRMSPNVEEPSGPNTSRA